MKNIESVPPTMLAISPEGLQHFIPESLEDELRGLAVAGALIRSKAA